MLESPFAKKRKKKRKSKMKIYNIIFIESEANKMFENLLTGEVYENEAEARESVLECMDEQDILDYTNSDLLDPHRVLKVLRKADSALYYEIVESAENSYLEEYLAQWEYISEED